ncbi:MAG: hypothetical protein AAGG02_12090 [Cyanobacteria bacterium P01_H01_bin.15]
MVQLTHSLILSEFLQQPATRLASEFVGDRIIQKPMPQGKHSRLQQKLVQTIN